GSVRGAEVQRRRGYAGLELGGPILEHVQQSAIGESARVILNRGKHALLDPLEPHARAYAVTPFRHAQVIRPGEVLSRTVNGVLAVGRREGRRLGGGRPASNDQGARIASVSSLQKAQASNESSPAGPVRWLQWRWG